MTMKIRPTTHSDYSQIDSVIKTTFDSSEFGHNGEAKLVRALRIDNDAKIELVAVHNNIIAGHIMLSVMTAPIRALGLAPVSVLPKYQGQGIGGKLIQKSLELARNDQWQAIFLLGAPAYYSRFGFQTKLAQGFTSPFSGPYFMALEVEEGCLQGKTGTVNYAPAFSAL